MFAESISENDVVDTYKTIAAPAQGLYKEKGSKFLAFAYPIGTPDEAKALIEAKRKEFHDARHVCYAYMLGAARTNFRTNDDGEPSGTAGRPILGQINANDLSDILIIVVRYFGGILLGTSGLATAYKTAAAEAIGAAQIIERIVETRYKISCSYAQLNRVMRLIKDLKMSLLTQNQAIICELTVGIRQSYETQLLERINQITFEGITIEKIET